MKLIAEGAEAKTMRSELRKPSLIAEGAEAKIYSTSVKGLACVIKDRIKKNYRLQQIDERLRKLRTRHEASLLARAARAGVNVPKVLDIASMRSDYPVETTLCMEEIIGSKVRDYLLECTDDKNKIKAVCELVGKQAGKMHKADITHGDLTTSNMIFTGDKVYFIDFGLGQVSKRREDKAVDIHLLKECLKSKHYEVWELAWGAFSISYKEVCGEDVFEQLKLVEARGRYKKFG